MSPFGLGKSQASASAGVSSFPAPGSSGCCSLAPPKPFFEEAAPMTAGHKTPLSSVIGHDGKCCGFVLRRRPAEIEAFGSDEKPIGTFTAVLDAVAAVLEKAGAE
jgi:hypothetical protein